jgi:DNA-binding response OmpR family regulator
MNGADATRAIRALGFNRLIFGLSGNALDDDRATFLAAGADCMIAKPLRTMQLDAILKHIHTHGYDSRKGLQYVLNVATGDAASCELRVLQA